MRFLWDFELFKDNIALIDEYGTQLTYAELMTEGKKLVNAVGDRCLIFCLCRNEIGSVLGYASFVNAHIVPVLLNANMDYELMVNLIEKYNPAYIWLPKDLRQIFSDMNLVYSAYEYVLLQGCSNNEYKMFQDLCLMLTTSGSTGSPKFVRQSYSNVKENAVSIAKYLQLNQDERPITTLPMNYTYGLSIINSHFIVGATILLTDKGLMQKEFWNFFKEKGATSFGGVPYTYEMLDRLRFFKMELPTLRYMTQAGGKLIPELHKKFAECSEDKGYRFVVMYGQCEATARMGYLPADKAVEKCGSMGIVIPGGRFYLVDADGNMITQSGVTGELIYEGPNVTLGYAECGDDLIKGDERGGILQTGDMAQFDEDGYYYIVGRKKRFLKIYGNRVNLDEVDRLIKGKFCGVDCACAGIDDHLYIFLTDDSFSENVRRFVVEKTGLNPSAFKTVVVDEIPKNDSGKILYKDLEKYYR